MGRPSCFSEGYPGYELSEDAVLGYGVNSCVRSSSLTLCLRMSKGLASLGLATAIA